MSSRSTRASSTTSVHTGSTGRVPGSAGARASDAPEVGTRGLGGDLDHAPVGRHQHPPGIPFDEDQWFPLHHLHPQGGGPHPVDLHRGDPGVGGDFGLDLARVDPDQERPLPHPGRGDRGCGVRAPCADYLDLLER